MVLACAPVSLAGQQCDPTEPDCFNVSPSAPKVTILPDGGVFDRDTLVVTIYYSDDFALSGSPTITPTGASILSHQFDPEPGDPRTARSTVTLLLASGTNTLQASISDGLQQTGTGSAAYTYTPPDPALQRMAPTVSTTPQNGVNRNLALCDGCSEAVLSHSTPAYVSLDQPRSVTLFYSGNQADPRGFVWLDVEDRSLDPAQLITLQLKNGSGVLQTFVTGEQAMHFQRGDGPNRIAGQFVARTLPSGSHPASAPSPSSTTASAAACGAPARAA